MKQLAGLVAVALVSMLLWRAEVEWHGWHGLGWIGYAHLAPVPATALFLGWVAQTPNARAEPHRLALLALAAGWATFCIWRQAVVMRAAFGRFGDPLALLELPVDTLAMPAGAFLIARLLGYRLRWWTLPVGMLLVLLHPLGSFVAGDLIHSVKTGWSIPLVVIGLGLPWAVPSEGQLDVP